MNIMSAETLSYIWPVVISTVFFIAWCVRLESKVGHLSEKHDSEKGTNEKKDETLWLKIDGIQSTMNQMLLVVGELKGKIEK